MRNTVSKILEDDSAVASRSVAISRLPVGRADSHPLERVWKKFLP